MGRNMIEIESRESKMAVRSHFQNKLRIDLKWLLATILWKIAKNEICV